MPLGGGQKVEIKFCDGVSLAATVDEADVIGNAECWST